MNRVRPINISYTNLLVIILNAHCAIRFVSKPMAKILGYQPNQLINKNINEILIPPTYQKRLHDFIKSQEHFSQLNIHLLAKSKDKLNLALQISKLKNNFLDSFSYLIVSNNLAFIDTLKNTLSDLQEVYDVANEFILLLDTEKNITFINQKWLRKINPVKTPIKRGDLDGFFGGSSWKKISDCIDAISSTNSFENISFEVKSKLDGKTYHLDGIILLESKDGKGYHYECIFNNVTQKIRSENVKNLYYNVSRQISKNKDLLSIYFNIHEELKEVIDCENFYIALYNPNSLDNKMIEFPYFIDKGNKNKSGLIRPIGKGIAEYVIRHGKPLMLTKSELINFKRKDIIEILDEIPESWIGVPLITSNEIIGVLAIQSYTTNIIYNQTDLQLLDFASSQIALAIEIAQTNTELQNQTARLNAIFDSSSHLIWSVNKNLDITSFNKNYLDANFSSYDASPLLKENDEEEEEITFKDFWDDKYRRAFKGEKLQFEIKLKNSKNTEVWKEIYLNPIFTKPNKIEEVSGIAHDITLKKRSEFELLKSEEKFRNIFESFQDVYFRCDLAGNILMASPSVLDLTGYEPYEVVGKHIDDYYLFNPKVKKILKTLRTDNNLRNVEVSIIKRNGEVRQCICNIRMVQNNIGELFEVDGVIRDITQLKITTQQLTVANQITENSLRVKEQFLANMSHEIRTPMNGIIGMIDLLADSILDSSQADYIETLKKSSFTLLDILNDILDLSKIEAGRMEIKKSPFQLRQLIDKIHTLFTPVAATNQLSLHYHINKSLPDYISTDETRLMQVLSNLVSNSLKFTERGGSVDIGFELIAKNKSNGLVRVDIRDSGIGISQENQKVLFQNFTQLDTSTTKSFGGTGLGLSISKELVALLGGNIGVYSNPGLGSTFWFTFQVGFLTSSQIKELEKDKRTTTNTNFKTNLSNYHILVVDDNLINREVAGKILTKSGCKVKLASSGLEAIEDVKNNTFDIVFMDIQMPDLDGIETTRKIKELPLTKLPKIIAMTAYAMKEDEERFLKLGMDDYIAKPIRANLLIAKVTSQNMEANNLKFKQSDKIINSEIFRQLKKHVGADLIDSVYDEFCSETLSLLAIFKHSIIKKKWSEVQKILHTIKGTASTLGIDKIAKNALDLENYLKLNQYLDFEKKYLVLLDNFEEYQAMYQKIIKKH